MTDKDKTEDTNTDANQDALPPDKNQDAKPNAQPGGEPGQGAMFTQAQQTQVDSLLGKRAARAKETATTKILEQLGVESIADAASILEAHEKAKKAAMTETERLQQELDTEKADKERIRQKFIATLHRQTILEEASKAQHGLSPDCFETLLLLVDMKHLNTNEEGMVTGADTAIEQAIKDHPILKANGSRGSGVGSPVSKATPDLTPPGDKDSQVKKTRFHL